MNVIIVMGAPGSGKGTQSELIAKEFGVNLLTMGDIVRKEVGEESELGLQMKSCIEKGDLVPDSLINAMFLNNVESAISDKGLLLDGYPRTEAQAKYLEEYLESQSASATILLIEVPEEDLMQRLLSRKRFDDTEDVIKNRLNVYNTEIAPVLNHYGSKVKRINGGQDVDAVFNEIKSALNYVLTK